MYQLSYLCMWSELGKDFECTENLPDEVGFIKIRIRQWKMPTKKTFGSKSIEQILSLFKITSNIASLFPNRISKIRRKN